MSYYLISLFKILECKIYWNFMIIEFLEKNNETYKKILVARSPLNKSKLKVTKCTAVTAVTVSRIVPPPKII